MSYKKDVVGHGYTDALLRVEYRPKVKAHTKEELLEILDVLTECGVDAWWYSVSARGSYPLFPSKVLPYKKDVATDLYPWLVEEGHRRGIVMVSWEFLNTAPLLTEEHPDWRVRYLDNDERTTERDDHFACFLSPYGEMLKEFCVEVFNDIGFDVIWFDGCYLFNGPRWSCCCERCAKAFKDAMGLDIPKKVEWNNPVFHEFIEWRYQFFENYWASLSDYVRSKNPYALVAYNYFNRHYDGARSGSPLRHRNMDAMTVAEGWAPTVQMQSKALRAINDMYPPEIWTPLLDGVKLGYPFRPNPDAVSSIFYIQAAATAGGYASFGFSGNPRDCSGTLKEISSALAAIKPYIGGEPVRTCGLVFSGSTKDFAYAENWKEFQDPREQYKPVVDTVYGMGFLLNSLHYPFEVILENQFDDTLKQYEAVILPDVQCMDEAAVEGLTAYVESGGTLIVTGETGMKTLRGQVRETGVLDKLLGITRRNVDRTYCVLEPQTEFLEGGILPSRYMISGEARLVNVDSRVTVLAIGEGSKPISRNTASFAGRFETPEIIHGIGVCERRVGKGRAVFIAPAVGSDYSQNPNRRSREIIKRLIGDISLPFTTDAPANVVVSAWKQEGQFVLHLLNQPASMCRMINFQIVENPEDFAPTGPIRITVLGQPDGIFSPTAGKDLHFEENDGKTEIILDRLVTHDVIVIPGRGV